MMRLAKIRTMDLKDLPDTRKRRFSRKLTLSISEEMYRAFEKIRLSGKDPNEFLRRIIGEALERLRRGS